MRLFTGIAVPADVKENLSALIARLRAEAPLRWSPPENFHITTKFLGETEADRLGLVERTLAGMPAGPPVALRVEGLGWFPNPHRPTVFWAGVKGGDELHSLAGATDSAMTAIGFAPEQKKFQPHLTLARISGNPDLKSLRQAVAHLPLYDFGEWTAREFHLYRSEQVARGSEYHILKSYPMQVP